MSSKNMKNFFIFNNYCLMILSWLLFFLLINLTFGQKYSKRNDIPDLVLPSQISINLLDLRGETDLSILDFKTNNKQIENKKVALSNSQGIDKNSQNLVIDLTKSIDDDFSNSKALNIKGKEKLILTSTAQSKYIHNINNNKIIPERILSSNNKNNKGIRYLSNNKLDSNFIENNEIGRKDGSDLLNIGLSLRDKSQAKLNSNDNDFPIHYFGTNFILNRNSKSLIGSKSNRSQIIEIIIILITTTYKSIFTKENNIFFTIILIIMFQIFGYFISIFQDNILKDKQKKQNPLKVVRKKKVTNITFLSPKINHHHNNHSNKEKNHYLYKHKKIDEIDVKFWYIYPGCCGDYVPYTENPILVALREKEEEEKKKKQKNKRIISKSMASNISYFETGNHNYLESFYNVNISDIYPDYSSTGYLDDSKHDDDDLSLSDIYETDENNFNENSPSHPDEEFKEAGVPLASENIDNSYKENNSGNKQISKKLDKFFVAPPRKMSLKNSSEKSLNNSSKINNKSPLSPNTSPFPAVSTPLTETTTRSNIPDTNNTGKSGASGNTTRSGISLTGFVRSVKGLKKSLFAGKNKK